MADFVELAFDLAFKYRNPAMILTDGMIGQMMEKVEMKPFKPRWTDAEISTLNPWATVGKPKTRKQNVITSVELDPNEFEVFNTKLQAKYALMKENEVRFEEFECEDADYMMVAYGSSARICMKAVKILRQKGIKVGLLRPITLFPFPSKKILSMAEKLKGILSVELSAGQMVEDVRLAVNGKVRVEHFGRYGGVIHSPEEVVEALEHKLIGG